VDYIIAGQYGSAYGTEEDPSDFDGVMGTHKLAYPRFPTYVPTTQEVYFLDAGYYNSPGSEQYSGALRKVELDADWTVTTMWQPASYPPAWTGSTADYQRLASICWDPWDEVILMYVHEMVDGGLQTSASHKIYSYDPVNESANLDASNIYPMWNLQVVGTDAATKYFWGVRLGAGSFVSDVFVNYDSSWSLNGAWVGTNFERISGITHSPDHSKMITIRDGTDFEVWPNAATGSGDRVEIAVTTGGTSGSTSFENANTSGRTLILDYDASRVITGDCSGNDNGDVIDGTADSPGGVLAVGFDYDDSTYFDTPLVDTGQGHPYSVYRTTSGSTQDQIFPSDQGRGHDPVTMGGFTWVGNDTADDTSKLGSSSAQLCYSSYANHFIALAHRFGFEFSHDKQMGVYNS